MTAKSQLDTGSFTHLYTVTAIGKIPVHAFVSQDTGLRVFTAEVEGPVVNGYFCLATEAFDDDGLPHTLEHLIFMASEDYPYKGVLDLLANRCLASGTNAWTSVDHTCYTMDTAGYEGFLSLMPIYLDHILYPTLSNEAFLTEVHHITKTGENAGVVYCEMQGGENSGESRIHFAMTKTIYPGHCGYSSNTGGIMKNLRESTTNEKVQNYHKSFYRPENLTLIITGQIKPEDIFKALEPIEKKILSKGDRGSFERPWQNPCPALEEPKELIIKYPSDDESNGMVCVAWRGPSSVTDYYSLNCCSMLLNYLTNLSIAPLQKHFVEIDDPYASEIGYDICLNSSSGLYVLFENVPKDKLVLVKPKLDESLQKLLLEEDIDLERLATLIRQDKCRELMALENSPHSTIAGNIIGHFLYGNKKEDLHQRINPLQDQMLLESKSFWVGLLDKWFVNNNAVTIQAFPSCDEKVTLAQKEKERIEEQVAKLGPEGLIKQEDLFQKALDCNTRGPPESLLTSLRIPDIVNINFHKIRRYETGLENDLIDLSKAPVFTYVDHVDTEFVYLIALIDTANIVDEKRFLMPLLLETMLDSPINRNGTIIPHEDVVMQLQNHTVNTSIEMGLGGGSPLNLWCGQFVNTVILHVQVEPHKLLEGATWIKELLYSTVLTKERLKIIATKMLNNIPQVKRSASSVIFNFMTEMCYIRGSNQYVCNMIKQQTNLTHLIKRLDSQDEYLDCIKDFESLKDDLVSPQNIALYCAANLANVAQTLETALDELLPLDLKDDSPKERIQFQCDLDLQIPLETSPARMCIVGMGCLDSVDFLQTTQVIKSYEHPDIPAIFVFAQYLSQSEGPLHKAIRGKGYAYGYSIGYVRQEGLLFLSFSSATNIVKAYKETYSLVAEQISVKKWDTTLLDSAKSSLIFEFIQGEQSIGSVISTSLETHLYNIDFEYHRTLLDLINQVSIEDLDRVGDEYFTQLFDPLKVKTVIVCEPAKVEEIAKEFKHFGMEPETYSSVEESFLGQEN